MRLSEAIRLGATLRPQAFGNYFKDGGSCALGAATEALGFRSDEYAVQIYAALIDKFDDVYCPGCPDCGQSFRNLRMISHFNDDHRWTRERIADWVELHEPQPLPEFECLTPEQQEALNAI